MAVFTNIEAVYNEQSGDRGEVAFVNMQEGHAYESWACGPEFFGETRRNVPIPQTEDWEQGLWIYTEKGLCKVIDNDWTIKGWWLGDESGAFVLIPKNEGAGGNIAAKIAPDGKITMAKPQQ